MQRITEKSDVYSYGVVLLEVLTGRHPLDPTLPGGTHLVQWAHEHLQAKQDPLDLLDARLRGRPDSQIQEMLQAMAIAILCICVRADDRPTMKDIVALLKEIRRPAAEEQKESACTTTTTTTTVTTASLIRSMPSKESSSCSFAMSDYSS
jgi:serine/threonine protein kinase